MFYLLFLGCYDNREVNSLAFVIAIGVDVGENGLIRLTLQFAQNGEASSEDGKSEEKQSSTSSVITVEASSIPAGLNLINTYISKQANLYHCKILVISEEVATTGVKEVIYAMINNLEVRKDCSVLVSRSKAEDFIKNSQPSLEIITAKYYDLAINSEKLTGYITNENLISFYMSMDDTFSEPVAVLGGINEKTDSLDVLQNSDGEYKAEEIPILNKPNTAMMGLAVFKNEKMVGELNGLETISYLITSNRLKNATISVNSPFNEQEVITANIKMEKRTKNIVDMQNGGPYITVKPYLEVNILSTEDGIDYLNTEDVEKVQETVNRYLQENISKYLYKTSKEFKSDISGFGKYMAKYFLTTKEWEDFNWQKVYENAFFNVEITTTINNDSLLIKK